MTSNNEETMSTKFSLDDRFTVEEGTVAMSGVQALVRLPLDQHRADQRAGLNTATFVSGYRGSPVGTVDLHFQRHGGLMAEHHVTFMPAVNEELGATAVWGSQLANLYPAPKYDGVLGMWYGKGPGVDRSGDALKHGNYSGVGKYGGVLAVAGDDPISKSSTIPSHSEIALYELNMPILYPGTVGEILELGRYGFEMSRYSGSWVGFKIITNVADGYATAKVRPIEEIIRPTFMYNGLPWQPNQTVQLIGPFVLETEREMVEGRLEAAKLFGAANRLNDTVVSSSDDWIGLVAAGKTYYDVREALDVLGLDDAALMQAGIRLFKVGMIYPLDQTQIRAFSHGLQEIFVIEEKRDFLEGQIRNILYNEAERPRVVGKRDEQEHYLVRSDAELDADQIVELLVKRLGQKLDVRVPGSPIQVQMVTGQAPINRTPHFCSGCPHNRSSTTLPEGSLFGAGIGCHGMAIVMSPNVTGITQMGGEGAQWVGASLFSNTNHLFQNLGDGTLFHSGYLAIRQAVAAQTNITYKILYNDVVAMTGGQVADGGLGVPELTRTLQAEGVNRIIVCTHDLDKYPAGTQWARGVDVWDRDRLDEAQEILRDTAGVTVLIYDQPCAADLRRKRKRGEAETPTKQVFINEAVCEGCGDCGAKSNCLSVLPVETEFGRKTQIHQSSCNRDYTCLEGDCPAFITIENGTAGSTATGDKPLKKKTLPEINIEPASLTEPENGRKTSGNIYMMGIGGTGVVTVNQILATAALVEGKAATSLDQTGLSQKGGAVISHLKIQESTSDKSLQVSNMIGKGATDAYIVFDILSGTAAKNLAKASPERTVAIVSRSKTPTGSMVSSTEVQFPDVDTLSQQINTVTQADKNVYIDAIAMAENLFGSHMPANMILVGAAYQQGVLPLTAQAIEDAIQLNGVAVRMNQQAFRLGRKMVLEPAWMPVTEADDSLSDVLQARAGEQPIQPELDARAKTLIAQVTTKDDELRRLLEIRVPELIAYQNRAYAQQYVDFVANVQAAEQNIIGGETQLTEAVARYLFKLMAYKDEYEVARLTLRSEFHDAVTKQFGEKATIKYQLHPPLLKAMGFNKKIAFGRWFDSGFKVLAKLKGLRGTPLDIFGYAHVRKLERALIDEYRQMVEGLLADLTPENYAPAVAVAELPDMIRGYEDVKLHNVERFRAEVTTAMATFASANGQPVPA
ncbi:MAG: indolepyruvate ferredoxin oxidoreductase family protein [Chloroflexota bacterium]